MGAAHGAESASLACGPGGPAPGRARVRALLGSLREEGDDRWVPPVGKREGWEKEKRRGKRVGLVRAERREREGKETGRAREKKRKGLAAQVEKENREINKEKGNEKNKGVFPLHRK